MDDIASPGRRGMRWTAPLISKYLLGQLLGPAAILTLLMTSVVWLV